MSVIEGGLLGSLVARAATGDESAFEHIVAAYHDDLARVCFVVCRDVHLAQEAAQATWTIAWRKLASVRDPERLRPWLLAIGANEARALVRRRNRRSVREIPVDLLSDHQTPPGVGDPAERLAAFDLADALAQLDLEDRALVGMRYAAGLST